MGSRWISDHQITTSDPDLLLYTLPRPGAGPSDHSWLARLTPDWLHVLTFRLPGRENRFTEPPLPTMSALATDLAQRCAEDVAARDTPFLLLGDCGGAYGAYEIARNLERLGAPPLSLTVLGQAGPPTTLPEHPLHEMPSKEMWHALAERAMAPSDLTDPASRAFFEPMVRADLTVLETYTWKPADLPAFPVAVLPPGPGKDQARQAVASWSAATTGQVSLLSANGTATEADRRAVCVELTRLGHGSAAGHQTKGE
jgi:medium-chain acyl-[acyl-carrier-protein] hydrolase